MLQSVKFDNVHIYPADKHVKQKRNVWQEGRKQNFEDMEAYAHSLLFTSFQLFLLAYLCVQARGCVDG